MSHTQGVTSTCVRMFLAVVFAAAAWGQSDLSSITGTVDDPSSSAVPKAKVTVVNEGTGTSRSTETNEAGNYTVSNIPAGTYTVTVEAPGFKKSTKSGNLLDANVPLGVDVKLEIGQASETVSVPADPARLQPVCVLFGMTVDERSVRDLMLNGRN